MNRHRIPRPLAAIFIMLGLIAVGAGLFLMVIGGITSEASDISGQLGDARSTLQGWLEDVGIDPSTAAEANKNASASISASFSQLKDGLAHGISALSGLAFFLALTILSLFFLLSDGPKIRHWAEGHFGVPRPVAHIISGRTLGALRGYFLGVTLIAGFNAVVVTLGALILGRTRWSARSRQSLSSAASSPTWALGPLPASRCCSPWEEPGPRRPAG